MNEKNRPARTADDDRVAEAMREGFVMLMGIREEDGCQWKGTASDLVELCHALWMDGLAVNPQGDRLTFKELVGRMCRKLHVTCPKNPTAVMNNIRRRKTPGLSLKERCHTMMTLYGETQPIARMVVRDPSSLPQ